MDSMTSQEAIELLDQAVAQLAANRAIHMQLQQAIGILKEVVAKPALM